MKLRNFLMIFSLFLPSMPLIANDFMDLRQLKNKVNEFLLAQYDRRGASSYDSDVKIVTRQIDPRLKLSQCANDLTFKQLDNSANRANVAVKVSCQGEKPWSIFVNNRVEHLQGVAILRGALARGHILTKDDIDMVKHDILQLRRGYITQVDYAVGKELKRSLRPGEVLRDYQLKKPNIVKKGDAVIVEAHYGSLSVIAPGIALADGRQGQQIRVENRRSARIIRAEIVAPGRVKINM